MSNILPKKSWNVYNEENKEKVKHDEEKDRIEKEIASAKLEQDQRNERLEALRRRKGTSTLQVVETVTEPKGNRTEISTAVSKPERFTLFPEGPLPSSLTEKTKTQKEILERESWVKPVKLTSDFASHSPWYNQPQRQKDNSNKASLEKPYERPATASSPSIEELRRKRLLRERDEREKAEKLLRRR